MNKINKLYNCSTHCYAAAKALSKEGLHRHVGKENTEKCGLDNNANEHCDQAVGMGSGDKLWKLCWQASLGSRPMRQKRHLLRLCKQQVWLFEAGWGNGIGCSAIFCEEEERAHQEQMDKSRQQGRGFGFSFTCLLIVNELDEHAI